MIVEARGLHKSVLDGDLRVDILQGVDFALARAEWVALVGPSGAGKSTLLHILGALDADYSGSVTIAGTDLATLSDAARADLRSRAVGFVFQAYNLVQHLTAHENVMLPAFFSGTAPDPQRAVGVLERVGMADKAHRRPRSLSGGEQQRVAIGRALYHRPELVLCDEPTGNLDVATGSSVLDLFAELHGQGVALLMATHDEAIAKRADRIVHLCDGKLQ